MVYIFFMLVILLPVLAGFGKIFQHFIGEIFSGVSGLLLSGIFLVALGFTLIGFFSPLNIYVEVPALVMGLAAFFYFKVYTGFWKFFSENSLSFFLITLITVFFGSYSPFILDHFGYYFPTIKWLSEFGLVKGISNLDLLLGQMSVWHLFQAGFSNFTDPFLRINVLVVLIYVIYILEKKSWIHLIFLPFLFLFSQSPSPDLPVIAISLLLLTEFLNRNKNATLLFAFSVFVLFLKPTMIWLPLFSLLYGLMILRSPLKFLLPGSFLFLLFIFKNLWTFGYPVFPVAVFDLGLSWAPNPEILKTSSQVAAQKTFDMQFTTAEIENFTIVEHIRNWLLLSGIKGLIHVFFILILLAFFFLTLKKKSTIIWLLFLSILFKSIVVLYFSAQYRFFLDAFFVILFVFLYQVISRKYAIGILVGLSVFCAVFLSFPNVVKNYLPSFKLGNFMSGFKKEQFLKPSHFELKNYTTHQIGNLKFNVVENYPFSFDTPLPAISPAYIQEDLNAGIFPQLKGETLKDGFIWRKLSAEEKEKLKIVVQGFQQP